MNENEIARRLLLLLQQNPNINLGEFLAREEVGTDRSRITQFRHYRDDEVLRALKLAVIGLMEENETSVPGLVELVGISAPGLVELTGTSVPGLIEALQISALGLTSAIQMVVPALIENNAKVYGNIAILYHKIKKKQGRHPDELCPCDRSIGYTTNGCEPVCGSTDGEFFTREECEIEINRINSQTGNRTYYHATYSGNGGAYSDNLYLPTKPPLSAQTLSYDAAANSNMWIVRPKGGIHTIKDYSYTEQKFYYFNNDSKQIYLDWWEIEIFYAGVQLLYFDVSGNVIQNTYGHISTARVRYYSVANFPNDGYVNGQFGGTVFRESFARHYVYPRFAPENPILEPPPISTPRDNFVVPFFIPWGQIAGWMTEIVTSPPRPAGPAFPRQPEDNQGNHYTIEYSVGGCVNPPIVLGEYLLPFGDLSDNQIEDLNSIPFNTDLAGFTDIPEPNKNDGFSPSQVEAFICAIGEGQFEVVINYGLFKTRLEPNDAWFNASTTAEVYSYHICKKDVFRVGQNRSKRTYSFPEDIVLHENNWMGAFLKSWVKVNYEERSQGSYRYLDTTNDSRIKLNNYYLFPKYCFNLLPEYGYFLNGIVNAYTDSGRLRVKTHRQNTTEPHEIKKILGADAGYINLYPWAASAIGVNFIGSENGNIYAIDADGHQFVEEEEFVDAIKKKSISNLPVKAGVMRCHFHRKIDAQSASAPDEIGVWAVQGDNRKSMNLVFDLDRSGTMYVPMCHKIDSICRIKQIVAWASIESLKQVALPMYGHRIKTRFKWVYNEYEKMVVGDFSFSTKNTWNNLYKTRVSDGAGDILIPYSNKNTPGNNANNFKLENLVGWPTAFNYSTQSVFYSPSLQQTLLFPLDLRNCTNDLVQRIEWASELSSIEALTFDNNNNDSEEYTRQLYLFGCQIVGICTN